MQANFSTWKRLAVAAAIATLPTMALANPVNGDNEIYPPWPPMVNGFVTLQGNDCAGVFGGTGGTECTIPSEYGDESPIIIKFNTFDGDGVEFPSPPDVLIEINSARFASITGNEFTFDCDNSGCTSGTWFYTPDSDDPVISFYVAKGGDQFNLFSISGVPNNGPQQGTWFTPTGCGNSNSIVAQPCGLSHISFYDTDSTPDEPVPEPGTLALLAAGLLGLGAAARRRRA
jgi:hypothetical protein